jgi:hypothetical protein
MSGEEVTIVVTVCLAFVATVTFVILYVKYCIPARSARETESQAKEGQAIV